MVLVIICLVARAQDSGTREWVLPLQRWVHPADPVCGHDGRSRQGQRSHAVTPYREIISSDTSLRPRKGSFRFGVW